MKIIACMPGRFQIFHKGHKIMYDSLVGEYGKDNVYITTTDVVELPKSPFNFEEKKKMMVFTGVPSDKILKVKRNYNLQDISPLIKNLDINTDSIVFGISWKDMVDDPRFKNFIKADGKTPTYLQPLPKDKSEIRPAVEHGYLETLATWNFKIRNVMIKSASQLRELYAKLTPSGRVELIKELFGKYSPEIFMIMNNKLVSREKLKEIIRECIKEAIDPSGVNATSRKLEDAKRNLIMAKQYMVKYRTCLNDDAREKLDAANKALHDARAKGQKDLTAMEDTVNKAKEQESSTRLAIVSSQKELEAARK